LLIRSVALVAALAAIAQIPICPRCQSSRGLCDSEKCEREVLPVLRESSLKRDTHSGPFAKRADVEPLEESTAAKKARRRNMRKHHRMDSALASEFTGHTRVRRARART
jgi:hypothetical protein